MDMKNLIVLTITILLSQGVHAADIARDIRDGGLDNESFFELGIGLYVGRLPLLGFNGQEPEDSGNINLSIDAGFQARLEYRGFFAEIIEDSFSDITLGYNAYVTDDVSIDIVATTWFQHISRDDFEGFESVTDRDGDVLVGLRSNQYFGDTQLQLELFHDVAGAHDGAVASVQLGRRFQYRNWNFHGLAGLRYFSEDVLQYYFGVSEAESSTTLAAFDAGHGFVPTLQFGGTVPINEKWIFRAGAEYSHFPDSVSDSSLAQGDGMYVIHGGVYRVFQPG